MLSIVNLRLEVATPVKPGYRFSKWDREEELAYIEKDMIVKPIFIANYYDIIFDGNNADDTSTMPDISVEYDSTVELPKSTFTRRGYNFTGWMLNPDDPFPTYLDENNIDFTYEGLTLYAHWTPIEYSIEYDLNGGTLKAENPTKYTIESETIRLNEAEKQDYQFVGWYLVSIDESTTDSNRNFRARKFSVKATSSFEIEQPIEEIETGTIGNITLQARYVYAGYVRLKDTSKLQMVYADFSDVINTIEVIEREPLNGENPVYLMNVYLGQTIEDLRNNFETEGLVFLDSKGNVLNDYDVVRTGMQVVLYNSNNEIIDLLTVVLKGDLDGNGAVNISDYTEIYYHIMGKKQVNAEYLLSALVTDDQLVNIADYTDLYYHIMGKKSIQYVK